MTSRAAGRRYAHALFDVAERNGQMDRVRGELADFTALVSAHEELARALSNPAVPAQQKRAVVAAIVAAAGPISAELERMLQLLADRDRLALLDEIRDAFIERALEAQRVVRAELTTTATLDDRAKANLVGALEKAVGRQVRLTERVDPAIIGGVVAKVGSVVFDGSVARQIERMRATLLAET
jgi:F-type H+-transporting ATPase subunit delta